MTMFISFCIVVLFIIMNTVILGYWDVDQLTKWDIITLPFAFLVLMWIVSYARVRAMWNKVPPVKVPPEWKTSPPISFIEQLKHTQLDVANRYAVVSRQLRAGGLVGYIERNSLNTLRGHRQKEDIDYYEDYELVSQRLDRLCNGDASLEIGDLKVKLQKGIGDRIDIQRYIEDLEKWQLKFNKLEQPKSEPKSDLLGEQAERARRVIEHEERIKRVYRDVAAYGAHKERVKVKTAEEREIAEREAAGEYSHEVAAYLRRKLADIFGDE